MNVPRLAGIRLASLRADQKKKKKKHTLPFAVILDSRQKTRYYIPFNVKYILRSKELFSEITAAVEL